MLFGLFRQSPKFFRSLWPWSAVGLARKAARLRTQGKLYEAVALLDQAIRCNPQSAATYANRCACYCDLEEYAKAFEDASQAIALAPGQASPLQWRARAARYLGRYESALADLGKALQVEPENPWLYYDRSGVLFGMEDYRAAIADVERLLELRPEEAGAYYGRARCRYCLDEVDLALADIDEAIRLDGKDVDSMYFRARVLYGMGRIDEASAQFDAGVAEDPTLALVGLGGLIALKQGSYREAIKHFDAMVEADPTQARTYYERGRAWCELDEYEKALHDLDEAVALDPEDWSYLFLRTDVLIILDRIEEASCAYEAAMTQTGEAKDEAWDCKRNWLGGVLALKQGDCWEAIARFNAALEADPANSRVYNDRAEAWYALREYGRALQDFDEAVTRSPDHAVYYINRANALMGLRRYEEANRDLVEARRRNPDSAHCYRYLAYFRATCPKPEFRNGKQAVAMAHKAIELAGGQPDRHLCATLAAAYAEQGDFDEAIRWQTEVLATVPEEERPWNETLLENYRAGIPRRMPEEKGRWDLGYEGDPSD